MAIYNIDRNRVEGVHADCFIIPNGAGCCRDFLCESLRNEYFNELKKYSDANGYDFDWDTKLIQVWLTAKEDLQSENLYRHHNSIHSTNGEEYMVLLDQPEYIPLPFVEGKKEGDIININIPVVLINKSDKTESRESIMEVALKLNQKSYRYRDFGNFEEVVQKLIG